MMKGPRKRPFLFDSCPCVGRVKRSSSVVGRQSIDLTFAVAGLPDASMEARLWADTTNVSYSSLQFARSVFSRTQSEGARWPEAARDLPQLYKTRQRATSRQDFWPTRSTQWITPTRRVPRRRCGEPQIGTGSVPGFDPLTCQLMHRQQSPPVGVPSCA